MFDAIEESEIKVGVIATNISDASSFIFSNYNGSSAQKKDCGQ